MNQFIDINFPEQFTKHFKKSIIFDNSIISMSNGKEYRRSTIALPKYKYEINLNLIKLDDYNILENFFLATNGSYYSFKFNDKLDNSCEDETLLKIDSKNFQINKQYEYGDFYYSKNIKHVSSQNFIIKKNNEIVSNYSVNYLTGVVTFEDEILEHDQLSCSCHYYKEVRFMENSINVEMSSYNNINVPLIYLIEVL